MNASKYKWLVNKIACKNRACEHKLHPSHNRSFLSIAKEYLWSVTCTIKPIKCLIRIENFMAISYQQKSYESWKFEKVVIFHVPTCPVFAGSVTYVNVLVIFISVELFLFLKTYDILPQQFNWHPGIHLCLCIHLGWLGSIILMNKLYGIWPKQAFRRIQNAFIQLLHNLWLHLQIICSYMLWNNFFY